MEIKDALALYDFIGKLGIMGGIAFSIIITVIVTYLISSIVEKLTDNKVGRIISICSVSLILMIGLIIIVFNSNEKQRDITDATVIKNYMVSNKWRWMGLSDIVKDVYFPDKGSTIASNADINDKDDNTKVILDKKTKLIRNLVGKFPEEFEITDVIVDSGKTIGIELIDSNAIKMICNYNNDMMPFYRSEILNFMNTNNYNLISYGDIGEYIDVRLQSFLIDKVIATYPSDFVPIFNITSKLYELKIKNY